MSRIENALEKATKMREVFQESGQFSGSPDAREAPPLASIVMPRNSCLVTLSAPESPAAEEYRKLKAMVIKRTKQGGAGSILMVTSCTSGEGKSLTSINLAVSLAEEVSHRALLIDADLRRSSVARYLGIDAEVGLADYLREGADPFSAILGTGIPKLDILPAGKSVRNPVELLSSPKMRLLLAELKRRYPEQYIIIDTPPVLPFAETQVISMLADGVLFVVKEGGATAQDLKDALEIMQGSRLLGVVFNDVLTGGLSTRYHHYYQHYINQHHQEG